MEGINEYWGDEMIVESNLDHKVELQYETRIENELLPEIQPADIYLRNI